MILIFSEYNDISTELVCRWLKFYKKDFIRIDWDKEQPIEVDYKYQLNQSEIFITHNNLRFSLGTIKTIWFRRGKLNFWNFDKTYNKNKIFNNYIESHLKNEIITIENFIYNNASPTTLFINNPLQYNANKLISFEIANSIGFSIPKTIITSRKEEVISFFSNEETVLIKYIQDIFSVRDETNKIFEASLIKPYSRLELKKIPDIFFYSCFQEFIEKKYELRIFVFLGYMYPVAILSQSYEGSKIDGKRLIHENERITRIIPYKLSKKVEEMCEKFMQNSNLNSGSIDLLVTPDDKIYFLEVNPVGQFDYVSKRGNYHIEKQIANLL